MGVVCWRWVRVAIMKPSDEPLRKGETQGKRLFSRFLYSCRYVVPVPYTFARYACFDWQNNIIQRDA